MIRKRTRGFSLIEILVGISMFATMIAVAVGIMPMSRLMQARASGTTTALDLGTKQLDLLRATAFKNLASSSASTYVDGTPYTVQTTITPYPGQTSPVSLKTASVVVTWQDHTLHFVRFETVLTDLAKP